MKTKGYKINACRTMITGVLVFYSQNCESIKGVMRQVDPIQIPENEFVFNQGNSEFNIGYYWIKTYWLTGKNGKKGLRITLTRIEK